MPVMVDGRRILFLEMAAGPRRLDIVSHLWRLGNCTEESFSLADPTTEMFVQRIIITQMLFVLISSTFATGVFFLFLISLSPHK